jgi:capsular exopolysaccharide synthesis family protein
MGKITSALQKAAEERFGRMEKISKIKERDDFIVKKIGDSKVDPSIVAYFDTKAVISEQYKILRTNLLSLNKGKPPRSIVITSSIHNEGKTVTALNLAVSLAQAVHNPRVLLVDADMRKGKMAKYLGVDHPEGLSEILSGKIDADKTMFHVDVKHLAFISSGGVPDNPAELLASETMKQFIADMSRKFDHIIIDAPPIIPVTDAGIIGSMTDGVLMIMQAGRTQRGIVKRAEELLYQSHCHVLGRVLTNIEYHLPEYIYRYL